MTKPRITAFRAPPKFTTPIGVLYRHIQTTMGNDGAFTIRPLIGTRVWDSQTKLEGVFSVRQLHNKIDVLRKHYGVSIEKMPKMYWFRVTSGSLTPDPLEALRVVLPLFEGSPITEATVLDLLGRAGLKLIA